jgi:FHA domain/Pyridine nucleotide-disulphide oxidoreductase
LDRTASELILHQEEEAGVDVRVEDEINEIVGKQGRVMGIITSNGARIPCDLLVMAIGNEPVIDFIKASRIACERGITVDHAMRSSAADVYAAGDVAETLDPLSGRMRILGQWYPAIQQGRAAAYNMLGMLDVLRLRHSATYSNAYLRPINTFSLFGFDIAAIGLTNMSAPAYQEVVADIKTHVYSKALLKNGVPVGMLSFDGRRDTLAFKRAIDHAADLTSVTSCLFDRDFKLANWLDAQKVPAPVLAVRKTNASLATATPARSLKSQFAPTVPLLELPDDNDNDENRHSMKIELPANSNSYALPVIPSAAFLAPILPTRTAQMLIADDDIDHAPTILLNQQDPDMTVAPEHTHTPISQAASLTIGRESTSALVINHQSISRHHAAITYTKNAYTLRDLGSRNGTFINETRLTPDRDYPLKPRDHIRIGNLITYQFLVRPVAPRV